LNRTLRRYPPVDISGTTRQVFNLADPAISTQFNQAQADRQQFARDIFDYLRAVTGAPTPVLPVTSNAFLTNRWLAQLAVNIVDFIDEDDYSTPFNWFTDTAAKPNVPYFVYGTELPRLVLNEVYSQWANDPSDSQGNARFRVGVWLELLNTLYSPPNTANPGNAPWPYGTTVGYKDDGNVWLEVNNPANNTHYPIYRVLLADATQATGGTFVLDDTGAPNDPKAVVNTATPWSNAPQGRWKVLPANQQYAEGGTADQNIGFYTLGPTPAQFAAEHWVPTGGLTATADQLSYLYPINAIPQPDVFLQRLLCPYLQPNSDPTSPFYNPYITVDYVKWDPRVNPARLQDGRLRINNGQLNQNYVQLANRVSFGRNQPYAGDVTQLVDQRPNPAAANQPRNTFFRHNGVENNNPNPTTNGQTLRLPFDWLVHLDRQLLSPMELLFVSGYRPYELTQAFVKDTSTTPTLATGIAQSHRAPWFYEDPVFGSSRLHRFLELVATHSQAAGVRPGGRAPGKININTLWDIQVFRALCDAQPGNAFRDPTVNNNVPQPDTFVDQVFMRLMQQRTPNFPLPGQPDIAGGDRPFGSLAVGLAAGTDALTSTARGSGSTLLRGDVSATLFDRLLDPYLRDGAIPPPGTPLPPPGPTAQRNPYQRYELLNKLFNNLTTRSNVFAVWLTVGFFEVAQDVNGNYVGEQVRPVKLGAEVGKAEGRNVRHRLFAIVDRTNLQVWPTFDPISGTPTVQTRLKTANDVMPLNTPLQISSINPANVDATKQWNLLVNGQISAAAPTVSGANISNPDRSWAIQPGSVLTIDPDTDNEETVTVQGTAPNLFATFTRPHGNGAIVISRGNPGPWPRYDPRKDTAVVPYFAVID
jgi:hypothetical protein